MDIISTTSCLVRRIQTLNQTLYRVEKGSGDMAVPKLFYFPNSGSGQLKYLRSRVRPCNWSRAPAWTTFEIPLLLLRRNWVGRIEGVAIEGYYRICSRSGCFWVLPTGYGKNLWYACLPLLFDHINWKTHRDQ